MTKHNPNHTDNIDVHIEHTPLATDIDKMFDRYRTNLRPIIANYLGRGLGHIENDNVNIDAINNLVKMG